MLAGCSSAFCESHPCTHLTYASVGIRAVYDVGCWLRVGRDILDPAMQYFSDDVKASQGVPVSFANITIRQRRIAPAVQA